MSREEPTESSRLYEVIEAAENNGLTGKALVENVSRYVAIKSGQPNYKSFRMLTVLELSLMGYSCRE